MRLENFSLGSMVKSSIRNKLILVFMVVALTPLLALAWLLHRNSANELTEQAFSQLEAVRTIKANQVTQYFNFIENQIATFSEDHMIVDAMRELSHAFKTARSDNDLSEHELAELKKELFTYYAADFSDEYRKRNSGQSPSVNDIFSQLDADSLYLQSVYIKRNPNPLGEKEKLDRGSDQSDYSTTHEQFHPTIRNYLKKFGYYDIFLCDVESGDIVYTVFKELDFSTSLKDGPYANTNIGRAFKLAAAATSPGDVFLVDYEKYGPSYDAAASFIAAPIFESGQKIGVAIFQMPIDRINAVMSERTGLGETGETYAVGSDHLLRNESRFLADLKVDSTILNAKVPVDTEATRAAIEGKTGTGIIDDYRGAKVLSAWRPVRIFEAKAGGQPIDWAFVSEFDLNEVRRPAVVAQLGLVLLGTTVILAIVALLVARSLTRQADQITDMLSSIGMGDFAARAQVVSSDELGRVAESLNSMCDNTLSLIQSADERAKIEDAIDHLRKELEEIASGNLVVEAKVGDDVTGSIAESVNNMVRQLRGIIDRVKNATVEVSTSATQIRTTSIDLSRAGEAQSSQILQTSAAVQEVAESIQQVATKTEESRRVAEEARKRAADGTVAVNATIEGMDRIRSQVQETSKRIKRLGESSQEIGEIVQLISDIADRTSILALNASIQAAMAGDAGQGFAVVAEEVERLAERSNDATKQIATLIKAIQTETAEAIAGMEESTREVVGGSQLATQAGQTLTDIDSVSIQLAELIASISQATKQQARGAEEVSKSMAEISGVTQQSAAGTKQAAVSVSRLAELADDLRGSVSQFRLPASREVTTGSSVLAN